MVLSSAVFTLGVFCPGLLYGAPSYYLHIHTDYRQVACAWLMPVCFTSLSSISPYPTLVLLLLFASIRLLFSLLTGSGRKEKRPFRPVCNLYQHQREPLISHFKRRGNVPLEKNKTKQNELTFLPS